MNHPDRSGETQRLNGLRRGSTAAPQCQLGFADGDFILLADQPELPDGILARFAPNAATETAEFIAGAPAAVAFLLSLVDRAAERIRALEGRRPAPARVSRAADYAAEAAMKCQAEAFARFLHDECGQLADDPAEALRAELKIRSRAELNAAGRWLTLRDRFDQWMRPQ